MRKAKKASVLRERIFLVGDLVRIQIRDDLTDR
jgi:hypothetical protein